MLYGVSQLRENVMHALGPQLRLLIERSTRYRLQAFCAGMLVTSLIQSSTATMLIVAGFASRQLITVAPALAVTLGADVGTTLVAQILSLGITWLGPVFVLVGMIGSARFPNRQARQLGLGLVGIGLILIGLGTIIHAADVIKESPIIGLIMKTLSKDLFMAFMVGALLTWAIQSSLATVLLVMSFASAGIMPMDTGLAVVLGTHFGSSILPVMVHRLEKNEASQIAWGGSLMRLISCLVVLPFLPIIIHHADWLGNQPERQIVNFHTAFSLARAVVFLPFLPLIQKGLQQVFPAAEKPREAGKPLYLDERDLSTPSVALASASREVLRLGDLVRVMLLDSKGLFQRNDPQRLQQLMMQDNHVDRLYDSIKFYLAKLSRETMNDQQAKHHVDLLMFITNLEHIGDIIVRNLCELAQKKWRNNLNFSAQGWQEIENYHQQVCDNFHLAMNVFNSDDPVLARKLVRQKEAIQRDTVAITGSHFDRLRQGLLESMRSSALHLDIIRDLRRINDHLTSVAYSILEARGDLQSRLREEK